jgi:hypothetical protein
VSKTSELRTYELSLGDKWLIPLKQYENRSPMVNIKEIITSEVELTDKELKDRLFVMSANVNEVLRKIRADINSGYISEVLKDFRFYDSKGRKYPSVSAILNPDPKTAEQKAFLEPYGLKGEHYHSCFGELINTGICSDKSVEKELEWIFNLKRFDFRRSEFVVLDDTNEYGGRCDADGFDGELPAGFDLKSGNLTNKGEIEKTFEQLSAYWNADGKRWESAIILPLHEKMKKEPIVRTRPQLEEYLKSFLSKRDKFRERYGI